MSSGVKVTRTIPQNNNVSSTQGLLSSLKNSNVKRSSLKEVKRDIDENIQQAIPRQPSSQLSSILQNIQTDGVVAPFISTSQSAIGTQATFVYGSPFPFASLMKGRIDKLNGFDNTVQGYSYIDRNYGNSSMPLRRDSFLVDLGYASNHPWYDLIVNNFFSNDTQGLCLWINGIPGRTIYLVKREQPYAFTFRSPIQSPVMPPNVVVDFNKLGFYFTTYPTGGSALNNINNGVAPPVFPGTTIIRPPSMGYICVNDGWPTTLFYANLMAPLQGGQVIVLGSTTITAQILEAAYGNPAGQAMPAPPLGMPVYDIPQQDDDGVIIP